MYLVSDVESVSTLVTKVVRATREKAALTMLAVMCALALLGLPVTANAQSQVTTPTQSEPVQVEQQVDINTADAETLALALDGVGMAKAQEIIAYREQNGEFKTADDLQKVRGIGKATLERNRNRIRIAPVQE